MPTYCEPCPVKRNPIRGGRCNRAVPQNQSPGRPCSQLSSAAFMASPSDASSTSRSGKRARPLLAEKHWSAKVLPVASLSRCRIQRIASARSPPWSRAHSASRHTGLSGTFADGAPCITPGGTHDTGASITTCALVPPKPNELTPARRRPSGHGVDWVGTKKGEPSRSMSGFKLFKCGCGGISPCMRLSAAFMTPATPAAASKCPILALAAPNAQRCCCPRPGVNTVCRDLTSIGSPSAVPVP